MVCGIINPDPFDFQSQCIRELWSSFLPAGLVLLILCWSFIPIPPVFDLFFAPFKTFLELHEAEALESNETVTSSQDSDDATDQQSVPLWRTVAPVFVGFIQCLSWIALAFYRLHIDPQDVLGGVLPFFTAITWLYSIIRPISHPIVTSPFDLFLLYMALFCVGSLQIGGIVFDHNILGSPWPSTLTLAALSANILASLALLIVVLSIPLALPSNRINKEDIVSPAFISTMTGFNNVL